MFPPIKRFYPLYIVFCMGSVIFYIVGVDLFKTEICIFSSYRRDDSYYIALSIALAVIIVSILYFVYSRLKLKIRSEELRPVIRYIIFFVSIFSLIIYAISDFQILCPLEISNENTNIQENQILFIGIVIAFFSIFVAALMQWKTTIVQNTMNALLNLRTDREYLIAAAVVMHEMQKANNQCISVQDAKEINQSVRIQENYSIDSATGLKTEIPIGNINIDQPSHSQALHFILNQYEFFAASIHHGIMDEALVRNTISGPLIKIVEHYREFLKLNIVTNPVIYENLIWLFFRFEHHKKHNKRYAIWKKLSSNF